MYHRVTRMTLLVVCPLCIIWALLNLARSLRTEQVPQSDGTHNTRNLPKGVVEREAKSHSEGTEVDIRDMWLEERAHIYKQRRELVKEVCERAKDIHHSKEGERFVLDTKDGIAFCMNLKVRQIGFEATSSCRQNRLYFQVCLNHVDGAFPGTLWWRVWGHAHEGVQVLPHREPREGWRHRCRQICEGAQPPQVHLC